MKLRVIRSSIHLFFFLYFICFGFGKNKVQYTDFTWSAVKTPHFLIHFHQNEKKLTSITPYWLERAYSVLSEEFRFNCKDRIPVIVYGSTDLFSQTNIITEIIPEEVGGFTELFKNRIAVPFTGSYKEFRHVLHHELVHALIFAMLTEQIGSGVLSGNLRIPLWFMEGAAEYFSSKWDCEADMFMIDQTLNYTIPIPGPELDGYMAYKGGQSFLFFLASSRGDSLFRRFMIDFKNSKSVENSIRKIYRKPLEEIGKEWVFELRRLYWPEIGCRIEPSTHATPITKHVETRDHFNLKPRISPDGRRVAFFSDRRDYTRILITDDKGKIIHEISQNGYGGFFESFRPFRSGMCWGPDNKTLAFITRSKGSDELRIVDIERKKLKRRIRMNLSSISNPDWSRDGKMLAFSGIEDGKSDLYLYYLEKDSLRRLTNSIAFESDPHFSPNGQCIVFSIEDSCGIPPRGDSPYGNISSDLALIDLSSDSITYLCNTPWNEKHPCFSPDGRHLLFISNRNGIDNCYIAQLDSLEKARPLTNYTGGCSNPDWSKESDRIVFSLFNKQGWDIWLMESPIKKLLSDTLLPTRWVASFTDTTTGFFRKAALPSDSADSIAVNSRRTAPISGRRSKTKVTIEEKFPDSALGANTDTTNSSAVEKTRSRTDTASGKAKITAAEAGETKSAESSVDTIEKAKDSYTARTPAVTGTKTDQVDTLNVSPPQPYRLSFSPDLVSVGLAVSTTYSPAGQVLIALSDLLGDHRITFAGDIQGNLKEYAHLFLSYLYLKKRINVGVGGFYNKDYTFASIFGDRLYHETQYGGFGIAQYPFSMFSRLELQILARHIEQQPITFEGPAIMSNMWISSLYYVFDNILWGITGPLNGIRAAASIQISPPLNIINESFISLDADVRHYWHLFKRFVWANRFYGGISLPLSGSNSARRYLLGGDDQWLIYKINIQEYEKNIPYAFYSDFVTPFRGWNYVDISGTRVFVFNSEFRFPFIRNISLVWPLPLQIQYINGALFTDVGNAWEAGEKTGGFPLPGKIFGGIGFGMRINLGIFILRFDRGWPTDWSTFIGTPINYFSIGAEY